MNSTHFKKGFTLIEIIISIGILTTISLGSIMVLNKISNNKELETLTRKVLEASLLYAETEKDENGNTYSYGINNGGKGVTIPLNVLVDKGFVSKNVEEKIHALVKLNSDKDYYILLASENDMCKTGAIISLSSWILKDKEKTVYLCDNIISNQNSELSYNPNSLYGKILKDYELNGSSGCIPGKEDGLCYYKKNGKTVNNKGLYYYTGDANNNILKIGEELFYIVRTTEDGDVKVVKKDSMNFGNLSINIAGWDFNFYLSTGDDSSLPLRFFNSTYSDASFVSYRQISNKYLADEIFFGVVPGYACTTVYDLDTTELNYPLNWKDDRYFTYNLNCDECSKSYQCDVCEKYDGKIAQKITMQSFAYTHLYMPIHTWYNDNKEIFDKIIVSDYKWCTKSNDNFWSYTYEDIPSIDFTCDDSYLIEGKFGLLSIAEYNTIIKRKGINRVGSSMYNIAIDGVAGGDLMGDFNSGYYLTSALSLGNKGYSYRNDYEEYGGKLRPALVLKGDLLVESGEGTSLNPYKLVI